MHQFLKIPHKCRQGKEDPTQQAAKEREAEDERTSHCQPKTRQYKMS